MNELILKILDDIRGSWRFRWWALLLAWVLCLAGWSYVATMPDVYQASARVYVDTQSALRPLLRGLTVEPDVESTLTVVRQAILSKPNLAKVARETDLDLRAKTPEAMEKLLASFASRITIDADFHMRGSGSDGLYRISFADFSRPKALDVVQHLLDAFVEDTLGNKREGQQDAQRFLSDQVREYEQRLAQAEQRLADFKKAHVGSMPDERGDYFTRLQTEMAGLDQTRKAMALATARRDEISRQLSGEEPFVFGFEGATAAGQIGDGGSPGDVGYRIREMEKRLEGLLLQYTEKHPEVIAVRATIADLKKQQQEELARVRSGQGTGSLSQSLKANPVYQSLQVELNRTEQQIAEQRADLAQRSARVAELQRLVNTVPEVEAQLAQLNRDYEVNRNQYQALIKTLETAKLSDQADKTGIVKFQIMEPPSVPLKPVAPNRKLLYSAVLVAALAAGFALAYVLNQIRPVFQNVRSLANITGLPVLGFVSRTWVERHRAQMRRSLFAFSGGIAALLVLFVAIATWREIGARIIQHGAG